MNTTVRTLGAIGAAWVGIALPAGVRPARLTLAAWRDAFADPILMAIVLVIRPAGLFGRR